MEKAKTNTLEVLGRLTELTEAHMEDAKLKINEILHQYLPGDLTLNECEAIACTMHDMIMQPKKYLTP